MHRTLELTVAADHARNIITTLGKIEGVVGLTHDVGVSVIPPGDRIVVHVTNRDVDEVLAAVSETAGKTSISVVTSEVASITDPAKQHLIDDDVDEAIWEEMETGLRHQGRVTQNYIALMSIGGVIAAAGLLAINESEVQVMAAIAAAIVAPGFDPLAKIPLGIVLQRWEVLKSGLYSTLAGYGALIFAACATYGALALIGALPLPGDFLKSDAVRRIGEPSWPDLIISACGAFSGIVVQAAFRQAVIAGALIALTIIDAAALVGIGIAIVEPDLIAKGLERLAIDVAMILTTGVLIFWFKQRFVHRRKPMR